MVFWFIMLFFTLLIPAIMLIFGRIFIRSAPKDINIIYGYRTERSMKNRDTWIFAHHYCGKLWVSFSLVLFPLSLLTMLLVIGKSTDTVGTVGSVLALVQLIPLFVSIFFTEFALKKTFDKDGNRL